MDLSRAFGYPFKDQNWLVKVLIGGIISIIPIVNFIAAGFQLRTIRAVMKGDEAKLPEWDDYGGDFMRGLYVFLGSLIYMSPLILLNICTALIGAVSDDIGSLLSCCMTPVIIVYSLAASAVLLFAHIRYAQTDDFNSAYLDFAKRISEIRDNISGLIMYILTVIVAGIVIGIATVITFPICGLGIFVAFAGTLMLAHLQAQFGQELSRMGI